MQAFLKVLPRVYGHTEDGPVYEDFAFVVVEADDGRRWAHEHCFGPDEEQRALKFEARVQAAIDQKGLDALDMDRWAEDAPRYGSPAHARVGDYHLMDEDDFEAMRIHR